MKKDILFTNKTNNFSGRKIKIDIKSIETEIEKLNLTPKNELDEEYTRELLQNFFDYSLIEANEIDLKPAFTLLNKLSKYKDEKDMKINLCMLLENLTFCFDLIYAEEEKRILFLNDCESLFIYAKPEKISISFLNILYKIVENSTGSYFFVSISPFYDKVLVKIEGESFFRTDFSENFSYINSIGGNILSIYENGVYKTVISLPINNIDTEVEEYVIPNVEDLLFDRLSVVYSSLF